MTGLIRSFITTALLASLASLAEVAAQDVKSIDIPAGDLTVALELLAKQSGVELVYRPEHLKGVQTRGVQGAFSSQQAVARLLEGTSLTLRMDPSGVMLITQPSTSLFSKEKRVGDFESDDVRLAQVKGGSGNAGAGEASVSHGEGGQEQTVGDKDSEEETGPQSGIPEILVTGSKMGSLNTDIRRSEDDAQPYVVFDREEIARSTAANLEEFFKNELTMSSSGLSASQNSEYGNRSAINLRGLGSDETLILVDGRRMAGFNFDGQPEQPDVNEIPLAAIERVEVLPTTSSGIYGGGATGGVINIVLRRDYSA